MIMKNLVHAHIPYLAYMGISKREMKSVPLSKRKLGRNMELGIT